MTKKELETIKAKETIERKVFGNELYSIMTKKEIDVHELSFRTGITAQGLRAYIRGECYPNVSNLVKICRALRVSPNSLLPFCVYDK